MVFAPGVRVLPWRSAEGRQGNPTAGRSTGGRRIQTGRAAGVPRLLRKAARFVGGADSGDPGSRPGGGGTALRCLEWESVCTSVCVRGACLGLGEQGKREKSSKQAEVFGPFKVMLSVSEDPTIASLARGFFGRRGRSVHQVLTAPLRKVWTARGWAEIWKATVQSGEGASGSDRSSPTGGGGGEGQPAWNQTQTLWVLTCVSGAARY